METVATRAEASAAIPRRPRRLPSWCFVRLVREPGAVLEPAAVIRGPADVFRLLKERAAALETEVMWAIYLNQRSHVRVVHEVSRGILDSSLVHPREVFRPAILAGAAGVIVAHNHPSGDPTPSADDKAVTRQLVEAGRLLDVPVYDHVVLGAGAFVSFAEAGLL